jgi:hypothetical protein
MFRLYHAVDRYICGKWYGFHASCIMRWIDLPDIVPDGF